MLNADTRKNVLNLSREILPAAWELALDLFNHPETAYNEHHAAKALTGFLKERGFRITSPVAGIDTAFFAENKGKPAPKIAFLAEMDALPELDHACGHHLIAASSAAAGAVVAEAFAKLPGSVLVIGTPAEEGGGGKIRLAEAKAFQGLDAALLVHPDRRTETFKRSLGVIEVNLVFHGKAAHAAAEPETGINALDAVIQTFNAVNVMRQQLRHGIRVHGIVSEGGVAPNIIPERAAAAFYVRGFTLKETLALADRVIACAQGAAMATGTRLTSSLKKDHLYAPYLGNRALGRAFREALDIMKIKENGEAEDKGLGSTDVGNAGLQVPILHPLMAVPGVKDGVHTRAFAKAAASPAGRTMLGQAISALALTGCELLTNPKILKEAKTEHKQFLKEQGA